jgi:hypothetical protein
MLSRRDLDALVRAIADALEQGDLDGAARLLGAEGRVLLDGYPLVASELGFARFLLARGDVDGALRTIRAVASGRRR